MEGQSTGRDQKKYKSIFRVVPPDANQETLELTDLDSSEIQDDTVQQISSVDAKQRVKRRFIIYTYN